MTMAIPWYTCTPGKVAEARLSRSTRPSLQLPRNWCMLHMAEWKNTIGGNRTIGNNSHSWSAPNI